MTKLFDAPCKLANHPQSLAIVFVLYSIFLYGAWTCHHGTVHTVTKFKSEMALWNAPLESSGPCVKLPEYCHNPSLNVRWPLFELGNLLPSGRQWCDSVRSSKGISLSKYVASLNKQRENNTATSKIPLIYINMNRSSARKTYIVNTFMNQFENIVRQPAITVSHLHVKKLMEIAPNVADRKKLAVLSSHWHAIKLAKKLTLENGVPPYALILEDDAFPLYRAFLGEELNTYATQLPDGWEVVQLGLTRAPISREANIPLPSYHWEAYSQYNITRWYDNSGSHWGAFAYLVSRKGMEKVLSQNLTTVHKYCPAMTADDCLLGFSPNRHFYSPFAKNAQFTAHPPLFGVRTNFESTHHSSNSKHWHLSAANAGNCMSLFENVLFLMEKETKMIDFRVKYNINLVGNDLRTGNSTSFSECKAECILDPKCGGLTFGIPSACFLKNIGVKYDQLSPSNMRAIGLISVVLRTK